MNTTTTIPNNATAKAILQTLNPPRGATHFRYTEGRRKPVIDKLANIDSLRGCTGRLEFGKAEYSGRGRNAKIAGFTPLTPTPAPAAAVAAAAPEETPATKSVKPRKNKIHGFSACAVAKALGAAGVPWEEADRIFRAHGIEMPKASLSVQLGFGRNEKAWERHGKPAPLSPEQIADLRQEVAGQE